MKPLPSAVIAALGLALAGCANLCQIQDPKTGQLVPAQFTGTVGHLEKKKALVSTPILTSVETVSCGGFDRVVFTFDGQHTPGFRTEYVDKPVHDCGQGAVVPVAGNGALQVQFSRAQAHTEAGQSTVPNNNRQLNYPNLKQLVSTCDFEGEVIWVLGVRSPDRYRIVELSNPPRVIVDVKQ